MNINFKLQNFKRFFTTVCAVVFFASAAIAFATTPNPGHPWAEVGDGTFQVSGPTALRTYLFPDADATVLTASGMGTSAHYYRGDGTFQTLNTAAVAETTNLYYTSARANADFDTRFATKNTGNLIEGSNLYYTQGRFDSAFAAKTTSDLVEGSNQYFTITRARGAISATAPALYDNTTGIISISAASTSTDGYLSSLDWNAFSNKVAGTRAINTTAPLSGGGDLSADRTISISQASGSTPGYLSAADWTAFNSKENGLTFSGPLSRSVNTISIPVATGSANGYLSSTDWTTFNGKEGAITPATTADYYRGDKTFHALDTSVVPENGNLYYTDARADARIAAVRGQANGIASLGADSKIPSSQLPAIAITDTYVVADEPAMLALAAQIGDVAVRTDESKSYILAGSDPSQVGNWQELLSPSAGATVVSVNGFTGAVSLTTDDIPEGANLYYTDALARDAISGTAPVDYDSATGVISMAAADTTTDGYLSSTDWNTFNAKENPLTFSGPLGRIGDTISIPVASGSVNGYLSSADWTTFSGKLSSALTSAHLFVGSAGNVATDVALSGDATLANTGALTVANNAVTLAKMADIATGSVLGRNTASTGDPEVLTTLPSGVQNNITRTGTITSGVWNGTSIDTAYTDAKVKTVTGTAGRITTGGTATDPTFDIASTYVGQTSITTLGTIASGTWNGSVIDLAHGGTNANLTASNGGIFYSTGSAGAILGGTATAGQILRSGSSAAPSWSTATYPATTGANQLLYSSATNTVGGLATANDGVLVTNGSGVPSISSTIPSATQDNITRTGTITSGTWSGTAIADNKIATPYIKADGTRTLSADWDAGAHAVTSQDFIVSGTGGAGYVNLVSQSANPSAPSATGLNLFAGTAGNLSWSTKNGTDTFTRALTGTLTADRNWALPDVGGTFMLKDGGQTVTAATWNGTKIGLLYGGTNADLSATGGTSQVLKQTSVGGAVTVARLAAADLSDYEAATDFASTANVQGFSSLTQNVFYYSRIGDMVSITVNVQGTSNATTLTFTLPYAAKATGVGQNTVSFIVRDNGTLAAAPGRLSLTSGSTTATATKDGAQTAWTASGTKNFIGNFTYLK
jgi:hypothetical protein